jgi:hypothetical protein
MWVPLLAGQEPAKALIFDWALPSQEPGEHPLRAGFIHRRLEPAEDWHALGVECAKLTVDICGLHLQGAKRLDRAPVAVRPIEACSSQSLMSRPSMRACMR